MRPAPPAAPDVHGRLRNRLGRGRLLRLLHDVHGYLCFLRDFYERLRFLRDIGGHLCLVRGGGLGRGAGAVLATRNAELLLGHFALAGGDPVGNRPHDQAAGADCVVVARDDEVGLVRIAVGVDERDDRHAEPARLPHGELLLAEIDDEDGVRLSAQIGDAAEIRLELLELGEQGDPLLGGQ